MLLAQGRIIYIYIYITYVYILLAEYIHATCVFKSNLNINPEPQLLPCTPACGYKFHALIVYLHPTFTVPPIGGAFGSCPITYHSSKKV